MTNSDYVKIARDKKTFHVIINNTVFLYDMESLKQKAEYKIGKNELWHIDFSSDLSFAIYRDKLHDIYYFDCKTEKSYLLLNSDDDVKYNGLCLSPDEKHLIIGYNGNTIRKYKLIR